MEDRNILAADCIVLCCCCQCMILQILIFILLKIPHKLLKKTKEYVKKFRKGKKRGKIVQVEMERKECDSSCSSETTDLCLVESLQLGCCMAEIERVFDDFSSRGEFAGFGSFWGAELSSNRSLSSCFKDDQIDYEVVRYHLMEMFGDSNFS